MRASRVCTLERINFSSGSVAFLLASSLGTWDRSGVMKTSNEPALLAATVLALTEGDMISVTFAGKTRTVRVSQVDVTEYAHSVYTTSGRTRPGHRAGGCLSVWTRDGRITFQPTMMQPVGSVSSVTRIGAAN